MSSFRPRAVILAQAVAAALAAACVASLAGAAEAGWWDEAAKPREATLEQIASSPDRWRDVPVSIVVRFGRALDAPTSAAFAASEWAGFSATSRQGAAFDGLVARRGSAEAARISTLRDGDELRIRAVVRSGGGSDGGGGGARSVVEVVSVSGSADALSSEELASLRRAEERMAQDNGGAAELLLRSVLDGRTFAPPVRAELWRRIARAERSQKKLADAAASFRNALAVEPGDASSVRELAELQDVLASTAARGAEKAATVKSPVAQAVAEPVANMPSRVSAPQTPVVAAPATVPVPTPALRLAPPRDRDGAPVPSPTAPSVPAKAPAPTPTRPSAPTAADELLPPPAPKLAGPK